MELLIIRGRKIRGFMSSPSTPELQLHNTVSPSCLPSLQFNRLPVIKFTELQLLKSFYSYRICSKDLIMKIENVHVSLTAGSILLCLARDGEDFFLQNKGFQHQAGQRTGITPQSLSQLAKEIEIKNCLRIPSDHLVALSEIICQVFLCF